MKKIRLYLLSALFLLSSTSFSQFRKVPAEVTEAFKIKFPRATEVSWSDKLTVFGASFQFNNQHLEADFTSRGVWKKTIRELERDSLPQSVDASFKASKYSTEWTLKAAIETQKEDGSYEYRLLVEKSTLQKRYLYFDAAGKLFREIVTL